MQTKAEFVEHFHGLDFIDPEKTNHDLIEALFGFADDPQPGVVSFECDRGKGATTTTSEWIKWANLALKSVVITRSRKFWKRQGFFARSWRQPVRGMKDVEIAIIDHAMSIDELRSHEVSARFQKYIDSFPYPAFHIDQRKAQVAN